MKRRVLSAHVMCLALVGMSLLFSPQVGWSAPCGMTNGQCGGECAGKANRGTVCRLAKSGTRPNAPMVCKCVVPESECESDGSGGCKGECKFTGGACTKNDEGVCGCQTNCADGNCGGKCAGKAADGSANSCQGQGTCSCARDCYTVTATGENSLTVGENGCGGTEPNSDQCQRARRDCLEALGKQKCDDGYSAQPSSESFGANCFEGSPPGLPDIIPTGLPSLPSIPGGLNPFGKATESNWVEESGGKGSSAAAVNLATCKATCTKVCCKN